MVAFLTFDPAEMERWHPSFDGRACVILRIQVMDGTTKFIEDLRVDLECSEFPLSVAGQYMQNVSDAAQDFAFSAVELAKAIVTIPTPAHANELPPSRIAELNAPEQVGAEGKA
ncbi:MAG TPA: hypothetical protein VGK73_37620 [Polyangiaceae bacterium]